MSLSILSMVRDEHFFGHVLIPLMAFIDLPYYQGVFFPLLLLVFFFFFCTNVNLNAKFLINLDLFSK